MRVLVAGAGPVGLFFPYVLKRQHPRCEIRVVEQNPPLMDFFRSFDALSPTSAPSCKQPITARTPKSARSIFKRNGHLSGTTAPEV